MCIRDRFLRHLARTGILLHIIDMAPMDGTDPATEAKKLLAELERHDEQQIADGTRLLEKERWLVLNKIDLIPADELEQRRDELLEQLDWHGPCYCLSAATGAGTHELIHSLMIRLEALWEAKAEAEAKDAAERKAAMKTEATPRDSKRAEHSEPDTTTDLSAHTNA